MVKYDFKDKLLAAPKVLPSLGGISKNYIKKQAILEKTLQHLAKKINLIDESINSDDDKVLLRRIKNDMIKLSNYRYIKKIDFYFQCQEIIAGYSS